MHHSLKHLEEELQEKIKQIFHLSIFFPYVTFSKYFKERDLYRLSTHMSTMENLEAIILKVAEYLRFPHVSCVHNSDFGNANGDFENLERRNSTRDIKWSVVVFYIVNFERFIDELVSHW
jgi:hypothetical protein